MTLSVQLRLHHIKLALCLIVLLAQSVHLVLFLLELNTVAAFHVLLYLHTQDISINWQ